MRKHGLHYIPRQALSIVPQVHHRGVCPLLGVLKVTRLALLDMHFKTFSSWVQATHLYSFFIFNGPRYLTQARYSIKKNLQDPTRVSWYFILIQYVLF